MATDLAKLGLDKLSAQERLELIDTLWDSLPERLDASMIPDWHLAGLARRRADARATSGAGKPWREVLDQLEARFILSPKRKRGSR
ncbi:MAG: addiction module protein [Planctomycetes bacterium]|nr:addiction module protein [Planctomycetota bacterium]